MEGEEVARMKEDQLTSFERDVLRHWTAAEDGWEEGADMREALVDCARPIRRESGMLDESKKGNGRAVRRSGREKESGLRVVSLAVSEESDIVSRGVEIGGRTLRRRPLSVRTDMRK